MARDNKGLPKPMPLKSSFVYDIGTGEKSGHGGKSIKGNDLRGRPGKNNGR